MLGPNGIGALVSTPDNLKRLNQFLVGGETVIDSSLEGTYVLEEIPERFEAGLQNYPGIIGFGAAVNYLKHISVKQVHEHVTNLNEQVTAGLLEIPRVIILGPGNAAKRGGILSFIVQGKNVHEVSLLLSKLHNIMVRSGMHCVHSWFNKPEHKDSVFREGTVRVSFGLYNTPEEVELFLDAIKAIAKL
jgi:cysteine desulfurase/selenocysteine lyase